MNRRVFIEKKAEYNTETEQLAANLRSILNASSLKQLRLIDVYDLYGMDESYDQAIEEKVLCHPMRDNILEEAEILALLHERPHFAISPLQGQYDQRADTIMQMLGYIDVNASVDIICTKLYVFNEDLDSKTFKKIHKYLFNPIDTALKDLSTPFHSKTVLEEKNLDEISTYNDFIHMGVGKLFEFIVKNGLTLEIDDLIHIQNYFKKEKRNPTETEIRVLDTYWSDHCRHTTFETELTHINISNSAFRKELQEAYDHYKELRQATNRLERPETLMDMGTIFARYQRQTGELSDIEVSEEVNVCSIKIDVDIDGAKKPWLLMFKNETHNHPTEIEPFGGASTCVGGAIRDILSGRAFVYQAMRITGAGDILEPVEETLEDKLPQRKISLEAAKGNSSYANQIGSSTTFVKEFYHPGFVAKRMELGALVGAVPESNVVREVPKAGDIIIMLGAKTGRDGVGGATGSSQIQTESSLETAGSEVQKGNPAEERKIIRLFRRAEVTQLIKRSNDFGAGGVSVAIGELADGVDINLDVVPTKYWGLNGTELAISESQERMAVVVAESEAALFIQYAEEENILAVKVAVVTDDPRLVIRWKGVKIVDFARSFLNTNGVRRAVTADIKDSETKFPLNGSIVVEDLEEKWTTVMQNSLNASQKGLQSMFDYSLGRTTVLAPYGGKYQLTPAECSIQKIAVEEGETQTVSLLAHGYNPFIAEWSPYHGAAYAIVEAVARIVASGSQWHNIRLTFQEYFERLAGDPEKFGKPVAALLGALAAQKALNLPSIGGKDSMSGSYDDIHVPPTLIAFAVATSTVDQIISPEFKAANEYVYLFPSPSIEAREHFSINFKGIVHNFDRFGEIHKKYGITAATALREGGAIKALAMMSFGNRIGVRLEPISYETLFKAQYGGFLLTTKQALPAANDYQLIGKTQHEYAFEYKDKTILGLTLQSFYEARYESLYPTHEERPEIEVHISVKEREDIDLKAREKVAHPVAYVPVFLGTHSEYDTVKALKKAGAKAITTTFCQQSSKHHNASIEAMVTNLDQAHIFVLSSGFITLDAPMGAGSSMAIILKHEAIKAAVTRFIARGGLILGINSGFQALALTGLLPHGMYRDHTDIVFNTNQGGRFVSSMVQTKILHNASPWLSQIEPSTPYILPFAASEGRIMMSDHLLQTLIERGQIISQYVDDNGAATMDNFFNPAGSPFAIEGLISPCGKILGKMTHHERYEEGLFKNIVGNKSLPLFENAVRYFTGAPI